MTWFKILNPEYSQKRGRREMFDKFHERTARATIAGLRNTELGNGI